MEVARNKQHLCYCRRSCNRSCQSLSSSVISLPHSLFGRYKMLLFALIAIVSLSGHQSNGYPTFVPQGTDGLTNPPAPPVTTGSSQAPPQETTPTVTDNAGNGNPVLTLRKYGKIEGLQVVRDWSGRTFDTFRGVPYAKPPVDNLRFEKPQDPDAWSVVLDAKQFGPPCRHSGLAEKFSPPPSVPYSEDCLKLNVFKPKEKAIDKSGYPVMVWIHGGGFSVGDAIEIGFENILDAYVSKGIIFVSFHFRLGLLGFLSLADEIVPGNYGLWDQSQALKWIHDNIADFGGDPNRVTVFGESSGGASVGMLTLVKSSRDYVQGAIAMSGAPNTTWAIKEKDDNLASVKFVAGAGCADNDSKKVLACLKKLPIEKVHEAELTDPVITKPFDGRFFPFAPNFDGDFFDKRYDELIAESPKIPLMVGITSYEGGYYATPSIPIFPDLAVNLTQNFTKDRMLDKAVSVMKSAARFGQNEELMRKLIQFKYLDSHSLPLTGANLLRLYSEFLTDILFTTAALDYAVSKREAGSTVYFYEYDYYSENEFAPSHPNKGAYHGEEVIAVFNNTFDTRAPSAVDGIMAGKMTTLFGNFVKYGNPTPGRLQFQWKPMTEKKPLQYLLIKPELEMKDSFGESSFQFWQTLVPGLVDQNRKCAVSNKGNRA